MVATLTVLASLALPVPAPSRIEEIRKDWAVWQPQYFDEPYESEPSLTPPFKPGKVCAPFYQDGLNFLRFVRKLAGVPYDIESKADLDLKAQHGSVLVAQLAAIAHQAPMPRGMDETFYALASQGIGQGNISRQLGSQANLPQLLYDQLLDNRENAPHVGHRRWILNPRLKYVGMGFVTYQGGARNDGVLMANDLSRPNAPFGHVAWPSAGDFPIEFCPAEIPWSVTLDPLSYRPPTPGQVTIELKKTGSSLAFTFQPQSQPAGPNFSVINRQKFGVPNAIIFRPPVDHEYNVGDEYHVVIKGLKTIDDQPAVLDYKVKLFSLGTE